MSSQAASSASSPLIRLAFYGVALGMALVQVFITFRGMSSATGMEQAQMTREMARGHLFETRVIRPYAWAVLEQAGRSPDPQRMPDLTQPPLQPLLWLPAFKLLEGHLDYRPGKDGGIFLMDRVIACYGAAGLLLTLLWTHGMARKLFDETVAAVSVTALLLCQPLWTLAVSGSPAALLLPLTALALRLLTAAVQAAHSGKRAGGLLWLAGLCGALMVMTHWLAVWPVLGLVLAAVAAMPRARTAAAAALAVLPLMTLAVWGWWMQGLCGDPLGGAKPLFQSHLLALHGDMLQRQFFTGMPPVDFGSLLKKLMVNWQGHAAELVGYLGHITGAVFFAAALLHRFRRAETSGMKNGVAALAACVALGMGFVGLPEGVRDDSQLYFLLLPGLTVFGTAMLAVLWARLAPEGSALWRSHGYAAVALLLGSLPLINVLPAQMKLGLTLRNRIYPHWPPYVPDRVFLVGRLVDENEIVFSDAPWFVAWYGGVSAVWVPARRDDFPKMKMLTEARGQKVAGFVMTPVSARTEQLNDLFTGPYQEWPDLIFRGPMLAFDREFPARADFEYKVPVPLVAVPLGSRENLSLQMTFYTDRPRTLRD